MLPVDSRKHSHGTHRTLPQIGKLLVQQVYCRLAIQGVDPHYHTRHFPGVRRRVLSAAVLIDRACCAAGVQWSYWQATKWKSGTQSNCGGSAGPLLGVGIPSSPCSVLHRCCGGRPRSEFSQGSTGGAHLQPDFKSASLLASPKSRCRTVGGIVMPIPAMCTEYASTDRLTMARRGCGPSLVRCNSTCGTALSSCRVACGRMRMAFCRQSQHRCRS